MAIVKNLNKNPIFLWWIFKVLVKFYYVKSIFDLEVFVCENNFLSNPDDIFLLKVNNRNTRTRWEICWNLTIKTQERCQWCRSGVFIVNFEHISNLVLMILLLTLNMQMPTGKALDICTKVRILCLFSLNWTNIRAFFSWYKCTSAN